LPCLAQQVQWLNTCYDCLQVVYEGLAKGPIICPKCCSNDNISSSGWRPGLHRVLTCRGQFHVLSFGYQCTGCPKHINKKGVTGKQYKCCMYACCVTMAVGVAVTANMLPSTCLPGCTGTTGGMLVVPAGANYCFASSDEDFLKANFDSVIFDLLPWELLTGRCGVDKELADVIRRSRGDGTAVLEVCNHRNEAVAGRWVRRGGVNGSLSVWLPAEPALWA